MTGADGDDLLAGLWVVERLRSGADSLAPPLAGTRMDVEFGREGQLTGTTGCNRCRGSFQAHDGSIGVDLLATTRRFCIRPEGVMEQEARFLGTMADAVRYGFDGDDVLGLYDVADRHIAILRRESTPDE
jgi:heat shock protein HslJ